MRCSITGPLVTVFGCCFSLPTEKALFEMLSSSPSCVQWKIMASCSGIWLVSPFKFFFYITFNIMFYHLTVPVLKFATSFPGSLSLLPYFIAQRQWRESLERRFLNLLVYDWNTLGNLRKFYEKKVWRRLYGPLDNFWRIFSNLWKVVEILQKVIKTLLLVCYRVHLSKIQWKQNGGDL